MLANTETNPNIASKNIEGGDPTIETPIADHNAKPTKMQMKYVSRSTSSNGIAVLTL